MKRLEADSIVICTVNDIGVGAASVHYIGLPATLHKTNNLYSTLCHSPTLKLVLRLSPPRRQKAVLAFVVQRARCNAMRGITPPLRSQNGAWMDARPL